MTVEYGRLTNGRKLYVIKDGEQEVLRTTVQIRAVYFLASKGLSHNRARMATIVARDCGKYELEMAS